MRIKIKTESPALRELQDQHDKLCEKERDHHDVKYCLCDTALKYSALKDKEVTP